MSATISAIQTGTVPAGNCIEVSGVAMSVLFADSDDSLTTDAGTRIPRQAFYLSEKNLTTTAPFTGIEVVATANQPPTVVVGDDLVVRGEYFENFGNTTLRLTSACGTVTRVGTAPVPAPAVVTITQVGQSGGSSGCPTTGAPWVEGANAEEYEGVLMRITTGAVSAPRDSFGLFEVASGNERLQVSPVFGVTVSPTAGNTITSLTGFGHFSFCRRKLRPRSDSEVNLVTTNACGTTPRANHLLISEVAVSPTPAEFVEIWNPTASSISLSDVYLYNATFNGGDGGVPCSYPRIISGSACGTSFNDFNLRFPPGATIAPGEFQTIAIVGATHYCTTYSCATTRPTYEVPVPAADDPTVANMVGDFDMAAAVFTSSGFLTNGGEDLVLYSWNGTAQVVTDLDLVQWGTSTAFRTDKTGLPGYLADTPIASQRAVQGTPPQGSSYQRLCTNEGAERTTSGNGVSGHDETSEDLDLTWTTGPATPKTQTAGANP